MIAAGEAMGQAPARDRGEVRARLAAAVGRAIPGEAATVVRWVTDGRERIRREEEAALPDVAAPRRQQFRAGRECAHAALEAIGCDVPAIGRGRAGEPLWPPGMAGSIAHTSRVAAAAVARPRDAVAVGIDLEELDPPLDDTVARLVRAGDAPDDSSAPPQLRPYMSKLAFCAKECVYKGLFPVTGWRLRFEDVAVAIDAGEGRFHARLSPRCADRPLKGLHGRVMVAAEHVVAGLWIPAQDSGL